MNFNPTYNDKGDAIAHESARVIERRAAEADRRVAADDRRVKQVGAEAQRRLGERRTAERRAAANSVFQPGDIVEIHGHTSDGRRLAVSGDKAEWIEESRLETV